MLTQFNAKIQYPFRIEVVCGNIIYHWYSPWYDPYKNMVFIIEIWLPRNQSLQMKTVEIKANGLFHTYLIKFLNPPPLPVCQLDSLGENQAD